MQNARKVKTLGGLTLASSMVWMVLLPSASFAAGTPAVTGVSLKAPAASQMFAGNTVTWTANASESAKGGSPEYQFWWTSPTTGTHHTTYRSKNTFALTLSAGAYAVWVYALDKSQVTAKEWAKHKSSQVLASAVTASAISSVSLSGNPTPASINPGTQRVTLTASSKAPSNVLVYYQFVVADASGKVLSYTPYSQNATATVKLPVGKASTVWVNALTSAQVEASAWKQHVSSQPLVYNVASYGAPTAVTLSAAQSSLVTDATATDAITATVVDAEGNVVANFNGTVDVTGIDGLDYTQNGSALTENNGQYQVSITNGVGTFDVAVATDNVSPSSGTFATSTLEGDNVNASGITYGNVTISYASPSAASIQVTPANQYVTDNANTEDAVTVNFLDQAGNVISNQSEYVTFTLTGPGSFVDGSTSSSISEYVSSGFSLPVWSKQGVAGTITVSAAAAGLSTGSATENSVQTTAPSGLKLTAGKPTSGYTVYTVQLVDAHGYPVAPSSSDALTISDNTNGNLVYYEVANGAPTGSGMTASDISAAETLTSANDGMVQFAVENTTVSSSAATVSVKDALTGQTVSAPYTYQTGSATWALFPGQSTSSGTLVSTMNGQAESGQNITYTVQVTDANGNPVKTAGQTVDFYFAANNANATINGSADWSANVPVTEGTNSSGVASVTVNVGGSGSGYTLAAAVPGSGKTSQEVVNVENAANYTEKLALSGIEGDYESTFGLPTSLGGGQTLANKVGEANVYVVPLNAISGFTGTTDNITVMSSNSSVVSVNGGNSWTGNTGEPLPAIVGGKAGSATLTITDNSNTVGASISSTISVTVGSASQLTVLNPSGAANTAYTYPSSGVVGPFTLQVTDAGGNVVPATAPLTLTAAQVEAAIGATGVIGIRTSSGGSDVSSVTINANQASVQVWLDGVTSGNATQPPSASALALSAQYPMVTGATVSGDQVMVTFNNPIETATKGDWTATVGTATAAATSATVSGDTVTLTFSGAPSGTLSWTTGAAQDGYQAAVQAGTVTNL